MKNGRIKAKKQEHYKFSTNSVAREKGAIFSEKSASLQKGVDILDK